jgi:hypothetical protein
MSTKKSAHDLINALKTLRLEEANLTAQLEEAIREIDHQEGTEQEAVQRERDREERDRERRRAVSTRGFARGDRVVIKNKLNRPADWPSSAVWVEAEGKTATVTRIFKGQVHFLTDNGVSTWRAPNNLRKLA